MFERDELARFEALRAAPDARGCREWLGCRLPKGYGRFNRRRDFFPRTWLAHRFAYRAEVGVIPNGALVCHRCDNPACTTAEHLFLGSPSDNMKDCFAKGRLRGAFEPGHQRTTHWAEKRARKASRSCPLSP
jgi:hypothetical protein